jgi:phosphomannomutase/phosphoglucomutase
MNPAIFREYDIRGIWGKDLTPEVACLIGKAFAVYAQKELQKEKLTFSVGRDVRLSSRAISDNVIQGLMSAGVDVVDIGECPTPVQYFSLHYLKLDGGVMITGSHNPPEYNGFKLSIGKETIYGEEIQKLKEVIAEMSTERRAQSAKRKAISDRSQEPLAKSPEPETTDTERGAISDKNQEPLAVSPELARTENKTEENTGTLREFPMIEEYVNYLKKDFKDFAGIKVVIDAGNGTAGLVAPELIESLGAEVIKLFCEPDGSFPNHHPDPVIPKNLEALIDHVKDSGAHLGLAYDGDADRIGVVDSEGEIIWGDLLMVIFSRDILKNNPGASIIGEVKCSQLLYDDIKKHYGNPIMWKTGHSLIKKQMKEEKALLAGEMSGHIFFSDRYFGYDDAIYATLRLIEILKHNGPPYSMNRLLDGLSKTYSTPEIRLDCDDSRKFKVVEKLQQAFSDYDVNTIDGARITFDNGWALVRASNTEPSLVMRFEAKNEDSLNKIQKLVEGKLNSILRETRKNE